MVNPLSQVTEKCVHKSRQWINYNGAAIRSHWDRCCIHPKPSIPRNLARISVFTATALQLRIRRFQGSRGPNSQLPLQYRNTGRLPKKVFDPEGILYSQWNKNSMKSRIMAEQYIIHGSSWVKRTSCEGRAVRRILPTGWWKCNEMLIHNCIGRCRSGISICLYHYRLIPRIYSVFNFKVREQGNPGMEIYVQ
jgi:hypothetical protein